MPTRRAGASSFACSRGLASTASCWPSKAPRRSSPKLLDKLHRRPESRAAAVRGSGNRVRAAAALLPRRGLPRRRGRSRRAPNSQGTIARVVVPIREGPRFSIGAVTVKGNAAISTDTILTDLPAVAGEPFLPMAAENALQRIRSIYWQRGYNEVHPDYSLALNRHTGQVDVQFASRKGSKASSPRSTCRASTRPAIGWSGNSSS